MKRQIIFLILLFILIVATFISYYLLVTSKIDNWAARGQLGDTFGLLNAFFSAMAILGIIYTIFQQNEIISHSQKDTENSIQQFKASIKQFEQQQRVQALTTLITIYEKKLTEYESKNETQLAVQTNKKIITLTTELENFLNN
jgi:hypothetical protein